MVTRTYMRHERVSHSEMDSFKKCKRKFWYMYLRRLSRKKGKSSAATKGGLLHKCLEAYCEYMLKHDSHEGASEAAFKHLRENVDADNVSDSAEVYKLLEFWRDANPLKGYTVLAVEKRFAVTLFADVNWVGAVDVIVRENATGKIVVVDFKSTQKAWSDHRVQLDPQIPEYIKAIRLNGLPADYGLLIQIRTQFRKDAIAKEVILNRPIYYTDHHIETVWQDVYDTAAKIAEARRDYTLSGDAGVDTTRSPQDMVCNMCPMRMLCISDLQGDNSQLLLGTFYESRETETGYDV